MIFADANGDGSNELVIGDRYYGDIGSDAPGFIAAFDLSAW